MATYEKIKQYVKDKHGFSIEDCWIAHMKEICGLPVKPAWNRHDKNRRSKPCPENKKELIREAFEHFGMI